MLRYLIFFFFSGISSLIYEVVWAKLLLLAFGSTTIANTMVISAFMLGLGFGGIYFGSYVDKIRNPNRLFSSLQFGIGVFSFLLLISIPRLPNLYKIIINNLHLSQSGSSFFVFFIAFFILFIPAFLMGGTFPVMTKIYLRDENRIKKGIGILYGLNTFGGVIGGLLAGFFLIRNLGLSFTQLIAIFINLSIGVIMLITVWQRSVEYVEPEYESKSPKAEKLNNLKKYLPLVAGLTGFASLTCEIFWIRALAIFVTNSSYTFTIILIVFLTGIVMGSFIFAKISKRADLYETFALVQTITGLFIVMGCLSLNKLPNLLFAIRGILEIPIFKMFLPALILSIVVVFVPTVFMGISFPLLCSLYSTEKKSLGHKVGRIYFVNTLGSALGSLFAGLFLIQLLGVITGLISIAFINLVMGALLTAFLRRKFLNIALLVCAVIISIYASQNRLILPPSMYITADRQDRVLYYEETRDGTIIVSEDRITGVKSCYVNNNAVIGTTYDALKVVKMLGNLPFVFNPGAKEALIIGFGVGITTSAIARYNIQKIDCVELCPGLRKTAKYFVNFNNYIFINPVVNFVPNDGRNFLLLSNRKYDIISCDPTHPILGSGNLYTREYFILCKEHLSEKGVCCQYLPFHKLSPDEFRSLIKTFTDVFPHTSVWLGYSHGVLVGTNQPQIINFEILKNLRDEMLGDPYLLAVSYILDKNAMKNFSAGARTNTDNQPILEFFTPLSLSKENWELNMNSVFKQRVDLSKVIRDIEDLEKLERYLLGQKYFIDGLTYQNRGDQQGMIQAFRKALEINPENEEIKLFLQSW
ncbi:MAG: fused MFS/spermidine synthase [bacterium]